jgi:replicative DNA helicase
MMQEKIWSIEAEQSVIGAVLASAKDGAGWDAVSDVLEPDDFYSGKHRAIFRVMAAMARAGKPIDVITLSDALETQNLPDFDNPLPYLATLAKHTPTPMLASTYAGMVRGFSIRRQLAAAGSEIGELARETSEPMDALEQAERLILGIADRSANQGGGWQSYRHVLSGAVDQIDAAFARDGGLAGLSTGFPALDAATTGLQPGDLVIIAGRPGMGKTTFAMSLAETASLAGAGPVAVFSLEMPAEQLGKRSISGRGGIELQRLRTGRLEDEDWPRLTMAVNLLAEANLHIDDTPGLRVSDLRARLRRLVREKGQLAMVMVDYLQLLSCPEYQGNRVQQVTEISKGLKALAREFKAPVLALSQLSRAVENRADRRPVMSDLRESGGLEQDADLILFVYRDEVYNAESADKGTAEIIIGKQRNGPLGTVKLQFEGRFTRFENPQFGGGYDSEY